MTAATAAAMTTDSSVHQKDFFFTLRSSVS